MPRRETRTLAQDDLLQAKTGLRESCPFCDYTSRSDHVRRHVQRFHPGPESIVEKTTGRDMTYSVLDKEHPNIVFTCDGPDDLYVKHQAYCFGCHQRIICKSKIMDRALPDCVYHKCKCAAKPRGPRAAAKVTPTPPPATGPDWRAVAWDLAKDRRLGSLSDELSRDEEEQSDDEDEATVDYRQVLVARLVLQSTSEKRVAKVQEQAREALSRAQTAEERIMQIEEHHQSLMQQKDEYVATLRAEMEILRAGLAEC